jgi:hypothetical protein
LNLDFPPFEFHPLRDHIIQIGGITELKGMVARLNSITIFALAKTFTIECLLIRRITEPKKTADEYLLAERNDVFRSILNSVGN